MTNEPTPSSINGLPRQVEALWTRQAGDWPMLASGIAALRQARRRPFRIGSSRVEAQCNPARATSTSARIDAASIAERACFLCPSNRPAEQEGLPYRDGWVILCNPAPLLEPHLTIATLEHQPQRIVPALEVMLDLARDLAGSFTVFYNGPLCGASAPDHLHLQATPAGATPFEVELAAQLCRGDRLANDRWLEWVRNGPVRVATTHPSHRPAVVLMGESKSAMIDGIGNVVTALGHVHPAEPEPMLNLFASCAEDRWLAWLFPRAVHRPRCYGTGADQYLISPGAIDLAGVVITPRAEDFERLGTATIETIYREVLLSPAAFAELRNRLR